MNQKINILLDLDNTLISSLAKHEEKKNHKPRMKQFRWENMEGVYKVFERPGLQFFLDYLFDNFNVSVWTAASKSYALFIIDKFILTNPRRKLDYIFFSHHCKRSKKLKATQKSLQLLKDEFNLPIFDLNSTYIIDDHPEVYKAQPDQCIHIKPFEFTERQSFNDDEFEKTIKPRLQQIKVNHVATNRNYFVEDPGSGMIIEKFKMY
jgi:TFIIF-interacting CTD phosphatase-like protein